MLSTFSPILIVLIVLAIVFDFLNGIHDSSNIVATMIASRAFHPRVALGVTAIAHFVAPFIFGVAVATTIGHEIVAADAISLTVLLAALSSAILWNLLTWALGIPSSSSHALIGGLMGAVATGAGTGSIELGGMKKILIALFTSPIFGLFLGYLFTKTIFFLARGATPKINVFFRRSQIVSAIALSLSHGTNDAQKTMGIITLALVTEGVIPTFEVPLWVITISAASIALGTALGGWSLIKTLGGKFYKIRPVHAFSSQFTSAAVILGASFLGGPVSTTQVVSASIMGVGSADRMKMVRWGVAKDIATAWLITIPITAIVAAGIYWIFEQVL
ncbi:MAG TPA: inorganic phosphate transporter [Anaerolineales bacterium]|nr:inorganic phosphate transporter [Anaerolineales bacterium]